MSTPLTDALQTVLTAIKVIPYSWAVTPYGSIDKVNPTLLFQQVLIWNDQVAREAAATETNSGYSYAKPACFLEMVSEETTQMLDNVTTTDYMWRFHVVDYMLDAGDEDTLDQNLEVIGYRDILKSYIVGFTPANCSTLFFVNDDQDYAHDNVYHYIIEMRSLFTDTKGSILDADQTKVISSERNTVLELGIGMGDFITTENGTIIYNEDGDMPLVTEK